MRFRDYALGSFIGMIPGGFINALLGSSLDNIISFQFFIALGCFILLMFIPTIFKAVKKGRKKKTDVSGKTVEKVEPVTPEKEKKRAAGVCPACGKKIGMLVTFFSWTTFGRFVCPACGQQIRFHRWLIAVLCLTGCFVGIERLLHWLIVTQLPQDFWLTDWVARWGRLSLSFLLSFILALAVMIIVPRIWTFKTRS
jgi:hypothetical protein